MSEVEQLRARVAELEDERDRYAEGLWECARISGSDLDDASWRSLKHPPLDEFAKREVQTLRDSYNEALDEIPPASGSDEQPEADYLGPDPNDQMSGEAWGDLAGSEEQQ